MLKLKLNCSISGKTEPGLDVCFSETSGDDDVEIYRTFVLLVNEAEDALAKRFGINVPFCHDAIKAKCWTSDEYATKLAGEEGLKALQNGDEGDQSNTLSE